VVFAAASPLAPSLKGFLCGVRRPAGSPFSSPGVALCFAAASRAETADGAEAALHHLQPRLGMQSVGFLLPRPQRHGTEGQADYIAACVAAVCAAERGVPIAALVSVGAAAAEPVRLYARRCTAASAGDSGEGTGTVGGGGGRPLAPAPPPQLRRGIRLALLGGLTPTPLPGTVAPAADACAVPPGWRGLAVRSLGRVAARAAMAVHALAARERGGGACALHVLDDGTPEEGERFLTAAARAFNDWCEGARRLRGPDVGGGAAEGSSLLCGGGSDGGESDGGESDGGERGGLERSRCGTARLRGQALGCVGAAAVAAELRGSVEAAGARASRVSAVDLGENEVGDAGAAALAASLRAGCGVTSLHLSCNAIGPAGAAALASALCGGGSLRHLHLDANQVCDLFRPRVLPRKGALSPPSTPQLRAVGAAAFSSALRAPPAGRRAVLHTLALDDNYLGCCGAAAVAAALPTPALAALRALGLARNAIRAAGAAALAAALPAVALESLDLRDNGLGSGICALAAALRRNATLSSLDLRDNGVAAEGVEALAAALQAGNKSLCTLGTGFIREAGRVVAAAASAAAAARVSARAGAGAGAGAGGGGLSPAEAEALAGLPPPPHVVLAAGLRANAEASRGGEGGAEGSPTVAGAEAQREGAPRAAPRTTLGERYRMRMLGGGPVGEGGGSSGGRHEGV